MGNFSQIYVRRKARYSSPCRLTPQSTPSVSVANPLSLAPPPYYSPRAFVHRELTLQKLQPRPGPTTFLTISRLERECVSCSAGCAQLYCSPWSLVGVDRRSYFFSILSRAFSAVISSVLAPLLGGGCGGADVAFL